MTIRGGGDPHANLALFYFWPIFENGPATPEPAADAHGCIMVPDPAGVTECKVVARVRAQWQGSPLIVPETTQRSDRRMP
jgi:hypothetical protein